MTDAEAEILVFWSCDASSVQFSSFAQLCPTLCDPVNRSTPGFPVHHQLPEFTQTHIHRVGDAIQSSHPLIPSSPCTQFFPGPGTFPRSLLFTSDDQNTGASVSIQGCFP